MQCEMLFTVQVTYKDTDNGSMSTVTVKETNRRN